MKLVYYALMTISLLSSCQQEPDDVLDPQPEPPVVTPVSGNLKATIDGKAWVANRAAGAHRMNGIINISGVSTDKKTLTITLKDAGVGRYTLNTVEMNAAAYVDSTLAQKDAFASNATDDAALAGGQLNITSIDAVKQTLTGTFSFRVYRDADNRSLNITEGSFTDLSYRTSIAPTTSLDTFRVKVNGTAFTPDVIFGSNIAGQLAVSGTTSSGTRSLGLLLPSTITPGTYAFTGLFSDYSAVYNPDSNPSNTQAASAGTLIILEHNTTTHRFRGTFSMTVESFVNPALKSEMTDGYFSVKYP